MSSRDIAELTGKLHTHVLRDIRNLLAELDQAESSFGSSYRDSTGRTLPVFNLPKELTLTLGGRLLGSHATPHRDPVDGTGGLSSPGSHASGLFQGLGLA